MQFSHCPKNVPKTILNKRFWDCVMFYVNKKCAKIQNTKLRIEPGTFFGQWKTYEYFSENIGPLRTYCKLTLVFPFLEVGFHLEDWLNHTIFSNLWHFPWNYPWAFVDVAVDEMQKLLLSKLFQITRPLQDFPILWKIKETQVKQRMIKKFNYIIFSSDVISP